MTSPIKTKIYLTELADIKSKLEQVSLREKLVKQGFFYNAHEQLNHSQEQLQKEVKTYLRNLNSQLEQNFVESRTNFSSSNTQNLFKEAMGAMKKNRIEPNMKGKQNRNIVDIDRTRFASAPSLNENIRKIMSKITIFKKNRTEWDKIMTRLNILKLLF